MPNLTPLSPNVPLQISERRYDELIKRKTNGWSVCHDQTEWMAKLHYLRAGLKEDKIKMEDFIVRERQLIMNWWYRYTQ